MANRTDNRLTDSEPLVAGQDCPLPIDIAQMREKASRAAALLKAMSNENRLLILCHLGIQEMSVGQLNECIDLSQSSLSQHLARLRQDGLVTTRRESQTIFYQIADPVVIQLIGLLHQEFCRGG